MNKLRIRGELGSARLRAERLRVDAQQQARRIIAQANARARAIKAEAKRNTAALQDQTNQTIRAVGEQAHKTADHAARLFRINLANTLTLFNGVSGFLSILAAIHQQHLLAASLILCGVLFDWLDGKAARRFGEEAPLGRELDSLSDLVTFGVAPAVIVATITPSWESYFAGALFVLSAALRLGRFNVQRLHGTFIGLPTTTNGIVLPALVFIGAPAAIFPWYLFGMALLMNAPIHIKKVF